MHITFGSQFVLQDHLFGTCLPPILRCAGRFQQELSLHSSNYVLIIVGIFWQGHGGVDFNRWWIVLEFVHDINVIRIQREGTPLCVVHGIIAFEQIDILHIPTGCECHEARVSRDSRG